MRRAGALVSGFFLAIIIGCSSVTPVSIRAGDICDSCRRTIENVKIAVKASNVPLMIDSYRLLSETTDHPLHLGAKLQSVGDFHLAVLPQRLLEIRKAGHGFFGLEPPG